MKKAAKNMGLYVNSDKTELMSFKEKGDISTLDGKPLKPVEQFTYLGSNISSIWKSDLTDKLKQKFFQAVVISVLLYDCTTWTLTKRLENKLDGGCTRMLHAVLNKSWKQHPTRKQL